MSNEIKRMDLNEFRNEGFLHEVNRKFFHPLGLALEVIMNENGNVESLGGIWDYRNDPEGMLFGVFNEESYKKIENVEKLRLSKLEIRKKLEDCDENGIQIK